MASNRDQFTLPEQMWFDPANPDPLHEALRADYARTRAVIERRPSLRRHVQECATCQAIGAAVEQSPPPLAGRKRIKLILTPNMMHRLLGLPSHFEIVHMFSEPDPNRVTVLVAGEGLPDVPDHEETPIASLGDVTEGMAHKAS